MKIIAEAIKDLAKELGTQHNHPHFIPYGVEVVKHFLEVERQLKALKEKSKAELKTAEVKQVKAYVAKDKAVEK